MNFIALHKAGPDGTRILVYLNPQHISLIESAVDDAGAKILLSNGSVLNVLENADDLILKIRGFTKPQVSQPYEISGQLVAD